MKTKSQSLAVITVRVINSERESLKAKAAETGHTLNQYMRLCVGLPKMAGAPASSESTERGKALSAVFAAKNSG